MIDPKRVKERVFKALKSQGYQIKMYDEEGMATVDTELTSRFYVDEPNLLIHVDEEEEEINFNKNGNVPLSEFEGIMWAIKDIAKEYMYRTTIRDYGKRITPKDFSYQTKIGDSSMDNVQESAMYGSKKTSRQMVESVCIVIKHKKEVDESVRGARSRNIGSVFLESNGERHRFPHANLNGARAMARHIARGGSMQDTIGESIVSMTGKMIELREFYTYTKRNKLISEDTTDVIEALKESIHAIAGDLKAVFSSRSYSTAAQRISEQENFIAEDDDPTDYKDMFTVKKFDEKFDAVLPMVSSIVQERNMTLRRIEESSLASVKATPISFSDSKAITYESHSVKMGHQLRAVSRSISENTELADYLNKVGDKMVSEADVSEFEKSVVKNVLENLAIVSVAAPVDLISESVSSLFAKITEMEDEAYDNLISEGPRDVLSKAAGAFKNFFRSSGDELMDLGTRLMAIKSEMSSVSEAAPSIRGEMDPTDARKEHYTQAIKQFNAARKGLSIANKFKNNADKGIHQSKIMKNINTLRQDVEWLEDAFGIGRKHQYKH